MQVLSKKEIDCLESYRFKECEKDIAGFNRKNNEYLLCVKSNSTDNTKQIDKVRRADVNSWEMFKSFFGCGKLAKCDLHLDSIAARLEQCDLSSVDEKSAAYKTIHGIATRMLIYKKTGPAIPSLWEKIATKATKVTIDRCNQTFYNQDPPSYHVRSSKVRFLFLTSLTKFGHLRAQAEILENKKSISAIKWAGWSKELHQPWYDSISDDQDVNETTLNGASFRIIDSITRVHLGPMPRIHVSTEYC